MLNKVNEVLAFTGRPPNEPRLLRSADLDDVAVVGDLFCACSVGDGLILKEGWRYLFKKYGVDAILEIDDKNWEWFDNDKQILFDIAKTGGYDPVHDRFGVWDDKSGFTPDDH